MGDVTLPTWTPGRPPGGHVGRFADRYKTRIVCQTCGTICLPDFELRAFVPINYWSIPDDDPDVDQHTYPFADAGDDDVYTPKPVDALGAGARPDPGTDAPDDGSRQDALEIEISEPGIGPEGKRAVLGVAQYPRRTATTPSRSPEARHREYVRRKRRQATADRAVDSVRHVIDPADRLD